jgi:hypothetical protein
MIACWTVAEAVCLDPCYDGLAFEKDGGTFEVLLL